jgi:hypothetical protein
MERNNSVSTVYNYDFSDCIFIIQSSLIMRLLSYFYVVIHSSLLRCRYLLTAKPTYREWVANHAITYVTNSFTQMKNARLANYQAYIKALPYWPMYQQHRGQPPLHPHIVAELRYKIQQADQNLRQNIDADWKDCVIRYPDVLAHYYSLVNVTMPKDVDPPFGTMPTLPTMNQPFSIAPAAAAAAQPRAASVANDQKKQRRKSMTTNKSSHTGMSELDKLNKELQRRLENVDMSGLSTLNGLNGINALNGLNGLNGLASLGQINGMNGHARAASRVGRGTPAPESQHQRPNGKKRQSRDYVVSGRGSAPPQVPVPPGWQGMAGRF